MRVHDAQRVSRDVLTSRARALPHGRARTARATTFRPGALRGFDADERYDAVVVGAGVIGLACARALSLRGMRVFVIDKAESIGNDQWHILFENPQWPVETSYSRQLVRQP